MKKTCIVTLLLSTFLINVGVCQRKIKNSTKKIENSTDSKIKELEEKIKKLESNSTSKKKQYSQALYIVKKISMNRYNDHKTYIIDIMTVEGLEHGWAWGRNLSFDLFLKDDGKWYWNRALFETNDYNISFREAVDFHFNDSYLHFCRNDELSAKKALGYRIINETDKPLD